MTIFLGAGMDCAAFSIVGSAKSILTTRGS